MPIKPERNKSRTGCNFFFLILTKDSTLSPANIHIPMMSTVILSASKTELIVNNIVSTSRISTLAIRPVIVDLT